MSQEIDNFDELVGGGDLFNSEETFEEKLKRDDDRISGLESLEKYFQENCPEDSVFWKLQLSNMYYLVLKARSTNTSSAEKEFSSLVEKMRSQYGRKKETVEDAINKNQFERPEVELPNGS